MTDWNTEELIAAGQQFCLHPSLTSNGAPRAEPIVIVEGHARSGATAVVANTSRELVDLDKYAQGTIIRGSIGQFASNWNGSHIRRSGTTNPWQ